MNVKNIRYDKIMWAMLVVLSTIFLVVALQYPLINAFGVPGPGFLPLIISVLSIICTSVELIKSFKNKSDESEFDFKDDNIGSIVRIFVAVIVYIILSKLLGFIIPFAAMLFILFSGNYKWNTSLIISGVIAVLMYLLFVKLLVLPLPLNSMGF